MNLTIIPFLTLYFILMIVAGCSTPSSTKSSSTHEEPDAVAQHRLGKRHYENVDYDKALELYSKAADNGAAASMQNLGVMYQMSQGVKFDENQGCVQEFHVAFEWVEEAAEQGNAAAQYYLGLMHYRGQVVPQNFQIALKWFEQAAEQGMGEAQNTVGEMYMKGQGAPQDYLKAFDWFSKAAEQGNANAQYNLGRMYKTHDPIKWFPKVPPGYNLGRMYKTEKGIPHDPTKWIPRDNTQGLTEAQEANLGFRYTHQDDIEAYIWSKLASDQDNEYVGHFKKIAASLSDSELLKAEELYKQRKEELRMRQEVQR